MTQETALGLYDLTDKNTTTINNITTTKPLNERSRKHSSIKKLQTKIASLKRNLICSFKLILASILSVICVINSNFVLFFHVKIDPNILSIRNQTHNMKIVGGNISLTTLLKEKLSEMKQEKKIKSLTENMSLREINDVSICVPKHEWVKYFIEYIWVYIDLSIVFLIPFLTMSIALAYVYFRVKQSNDTYAEFQVDHGQKLNREIYARKINKNKRIVLKLFIINAYFLVSILPYFLSSFFVHSEFGLSRNFVMSLFYSNNAMNIIFYGITCSRFRDEMRKIICFCRKRSTFLHKQETKG